MFTAAIENLEVHLKNSNLSMGQSAICFKPSAQKKRLINKRQVHHITYTQSLFYRNICFSWENLSQNHLSTSTLDYFYLQKISCQIDSWGKEKEF